MPEILHIRKIEATAANLIQINTDPPHQGILTIQSDLLFFLVRSVEMRLLPVKIKRIVHCGEDTVLISLLRHKWHQTPHAEKQPRHGIPLQRQQSPHFPLG